MSSYHKLVKRVNRAKKELLKLQKEVHKKLREHPTPAIRKELLNRINNAKKDLKLYEYAAYCQLNKCLNKTTK